MVNRILRLGERVMGRDDERPSRFHSRRGDLLPAAELARAPQMLVDRLRSRPAEAQPWMARGAVERLKTLLDQQTTLLELGSGSSTLWFAQHAGTTVSLEDNAEWADRVGQLTNGTKNVELRRIVSLSVALEALEGDFDIGVVDHRDSATWTRVDSVRTLKDRCATLLLDDSDRRQYGAVDAILRGWAVERYRSLRPSPFQATETSIFFRP